MESHLEIQIDEQKNWKETQNDDLNKYYIEGEFEAFQEIVDFREMEIEKLCEILQNYKMNQKIEDERNDESGLIKEEHLDEGETFRDLKHFATEQIYKEINCFIEWNYLMKTINLEKEGLYLKLKKEPINYKKMIKISGILTNVKYEIITIEKADFIFSNSLYFIILLFKSFNKNFIGKI